jgi:hypothetical protein
LLIKLQIFKKEEILMSTVSEELTKKLEAGQAFEDEEKSADAISLYEGIIAYKFKNEDEITDDTVKAKE